MKRHFTKDHFPVKANYLLPTNTKQWTLLVTIFNRRFFHFFFTQETSQEHLRSTKHCRWMCCFLRSEWHQYPCIKMFPWRGNMIHSQAIWSNLEAISHCEGITVMIFFSVRILPGVLSNRKIAQLPQSHLNCFLKISSLTHQSQWWESFDYWRDKAFWIGTLSQSHISPLHLHQAINAICCRRGHCRNVLPVPLLNRQP